MSSPITYMIIRSLITPAPALEPDDCAICQGLGKVGVKRDDKTPNGTMRSVLEEVPCSNCGGKGKIGLAEDSDDIPINSENVQGEPGTGYEDGNDKGEFECGNCEHFAKDTSSCGQEDMMKLSKHPKLAGSDRIIVDEEGCCEYVSRIGLKDKDKD